MPECSWAVRGGIAWFTFNRPDKRNALTSAMLAELRERISEVASDDAVEALVLTGSGGSFSGGIDLSEFAARDSLSAARDFLLANNAAVDALECFPKLAIAAVDGPAYGLGFVLALAADFIVATERSVFCLPECHLGMADTVNGVRLSQRVGPSRAKDLTLAGRSLGAAEAERWGIVNRLVPDGGQLVPAAEELARSARKSHPFVVTAVKEAIRVHKPPADFGAMLLSLGLTGALDRAAGHKSGTS